jgi:tRNA (adenine57-N1/adenine58-N1)-methyltransferase
LSWNLLGTKTKEGDLVQLVGLRHKHFLVELKAGQVLHTHRGMIRHDDIIGIPYGIQVFSHNGSPFYLLQPSLGDVMRDLPRSTQIMYPKDVGFILQSMSIGPGQHILEAGTGSGSFTSALAFAVGATGKVTTYEAREEMQKKAKENINYLGLADRVEFKLRNITDGFDERNVDALFLDLPNPYDYVPQVREALKPGGFFGTLLPTTNQIQTTIRALRRADFAFVDVCEIMMRYYKTEPDRFRPTDRMVAHTGYLLFGRPVIIDHSAVDEGLMEEAGLGSGQLDE